MLKALLDTNQIILHINGKLRLAFESGEVAISSLTCFETLRLPGISEEEERQINDLLSLCKVFSVTDEIARRAAAIARARKKTVRPVDLLIAATALEVGLPLITKNVRDFKGIKDLVVQTSM